MAIMYGTWKPKNVANISLGFNQEQTVEKVKAFHRCIHLYVDIDLQWNNRIHWHMWSPG
jgi:hypothetical protein